MNIERWLYPRPEVRWSLKQHEGEIIWIPVYKKAEGQEGHSPKDRLINLKSMKTVEEDINTTDVRQSFVSSEVSYSKAIDPFTHQRYNIDSVPEAPKIMEINIKYRNSLGIGEADTDRFISKSETIVSYQSSIQQSEPGFLDFLYKGPKTESIKTHQFSSSHTAGLPNATLSQSSLEWAKNQEVEYRIPCLFLKQNQYQTKILIYFHSNAEDIHLSYSFCRHLMIQLNVCVLAVEYPGYSYFQDVETTEEMICENAERVFDFLTTELNIPQHDVYVLGRSIGCTPAIHVATKRQPGMLVVVSPFLSIKQLLKDHWGLVGSLGYLVIKNGYDNESKIPHIKSPTLIIHGKKDDLIHFNHSVTIFEKMAGKVELILPDEMTHSLIDPFVHITEPISRFMDKTLRQDKHLFSTHITIPSRYFRSN